MVYRLYIYGIYIIYRWYIVAGGFHYYRTRSLTGYSRLLLAPVKCWWLSAIKGELWAIAKIDL